MARQPPGPWFKSFTAAAALLAPTLPAPPAAAEECLRYAPARIEVAGVLVRRLVDRPPSVDLFVDPRDVEVGDDEPPQSIADAAGGPLGAVPERGGGAPPAFGPPRAAPGQPAEPAATATRAAPAAAPPSAPSQSPPPPAPEGPPPEEALGPPRPPASFPAPLVRPKPPDEIWVVRLRRPVCVRADPGDFINVSEKRIAEIQILSFPQSRRELAAISELRVLVRGQLLHAISPRHHTQVLIVAEAIEPEARALAVPSTGDAPPLR